MIPYRFATVALAACVLFFSACWRQDITKPDGASSGKGKPVPMVPFGTGSVPQTSKLDEEGVTAVSKMLRVSFADCDSPEFEKSASVALGKLFPAWIPKGSTKEQRASRCHIRAAVREWIACDTLVESEKNECEKLTNAISVLTSTGRVTPKIRAEATGTYSKYFIDPVKFPPKSAPVLEK